MTSAPTSSSPTGCKYVAETDERFDAIIVDSSEPIGPSAVLHTREFFTDCKRALKEGGILVTQNGLPFLFPEHLQWHDRASFASLFKRGGALHVHAALLLRRPRSALNSATDDAKHAGQGRCQAALAKRQNKRASRPQLLDARACHSRRLSPCPLTRHRWPIRPSTRERARGGRARSLLRRRRWSAKPGLSRACAGALKDRWTGSTPAQALSAPGREQIFRPALCRARRPASAGRTRRKGRCRGSSSKTMRAA